MRVFAYLVLSLTISLVSVFGQTVTLGGTEEAVQKGTQQVRSEDGGVTETLQSIFIPPKPTRRSRSRCKLSGSKVCRMEGPLP